MIFLEFYVKKQVNPPTNSGTINTPVYQSRRNLIVLHDQVEILEQDNGICIINDHLQGKSYHPTETYSQILNKVSKAAIIV